MCDNPNWPFQSRAMHVFDQRLAAYENEIAGLKAEVARLEKKAGEVLDERVRDAQQASANMFKAALAGGTVGKRTTEGKDDGD